MKARNLSLDGVRGLAILLVILFHIRPDEAPPGVVNKVLFMFEASGWCGVDLFFVLSGFLITSLLWQVKTSPHYFRNFYAKRALRIFPLYYAYLAAMLLVVPLILNVPRTPEFAEISKSQAWLWLYGSNIIMTVKQRWFFDAFEWLTFNHFWSLAVEEHFYLVWPAAVLALSRKRLMTLCFGLIALALLLRIGLTLHKSHSIVTYAFTPCRMDSLAIGALIALVAQTEEGLAGLRKHAPQGLLVFSMLTLAIFGWRKGLRTDDNVVRSIGFTILALMFGSLLCVLLTSPGGRLARIMQTRGLRVLGEYSYGLYVFHRLVLFGLEEAKLPQTLEHRTGSPLLGSILYIAIALVTCVAAAWLCFHLFEKHFLTLKRHFEPSERRSST